MPNWICNKLSILDVDDDTRVEILKAIATRDENGNPVIHTIDFNRIVPMPDDIYRGDLGSDEMKKYGDKNWYDWSIKHWGTKWNACDFIDNPQEYGADIIFNTAWDTPEPIFQTLWNMFPDAHFVVKYADEDIGCNCGIFDFKGETDFAQYTDKSTDSCAMEDAIRFACEVWDYDADDYLREIQEEG